MKNIPGSRIWSIKKEKLHFSFSFLITQVLEIQNKILKNVFNVRTYSTLRFIMKCGEKNCSGSREWITFNCYLSIGKNEKSRIAITAQCYR